MESDETHLLSALLAPAVDELNAALIAAAFAKAAFMAPNMDGRAKIPHFHCSSRSERRLTPNGLTSSAALIGDQEGGTLLEIKCYMVIQWGDCR